jgi:hypothetical protein
MPMTLPCVDVRIDAAAKEIIEVAVERITRQKMRQALSGKRLKNTPCESKQKIDGMLYWLLDNSASF